MMRIIEDPNCDLFYFVSVTHYANHMDISEYQVFKEAAEAASYSGIYVERAFGQYLKTQEVAAWVTSYVKKKAILIV